MTETLTHIDPNCTGVFEIEKRKKGTVLRCPQCRMIWPASNVNRTEAAEEIVMGRIMKQLAVQGEKLLQQCDGEGGSSD